MGAEASIHAALMARVQSLTLAPAVPVSFPGVPFDTTAGNYIRVTHIRNRPVQHIITAGVAGERMGLLQIDLFTVITAGSWQIIADDMADDIAAHFPRGLRMTSGGHTARVYQSWVGQSVKDPDGTHWQTPVIVDYRAYG